MAGFELILWLLALWLIVAAGMAVIYWIVVSTRRSTSLPRRSAEVDRVAQAADAKLDYLTRATIQQMREAARPEPPLWTRDQ